MPVPVIESITPYQGVGLVTSLDCPRPVGFVSGNMALLVAFSDSNNDSEPVWAISGGGTWTLIAEVNIGGQDRKVGLWRQFDPPDETTVVSFVGRTDQLVVLYCRVSGVDSSTPIDVIGTAQTGGSTGGANFTVVDPLTTVAADSLAILLVGWDGFDGSFSIVTSGWSSIVQSGYGGAGGVTGVLITKDMASPGAVGSVEVNPPANDGWLALGVSLRGASGGGPTGPTWSYYNGSALVATTAKYYNGSALVAVTPAIN